MAALMFSTRLASKGAPAELVVSAPASFAERLEIGALDPLGARDVAAGCLPSELTPFVAGVLP